MLFKLISLLIMLHCIAARSTELSNQYVSSLINSQNNALQDKSFSEILLLAKNNDIAGMTYLANYFIYPGTENYRPSRSRFWFEQLLNKGEKINQGLYILSQIDSHESEDVTAAALITFYKNHKPSSWEYRLLTAVDYEKGLTRLKSNTMAQNLYLELQKAGVNINRYIAILNVSMFGPRLFDSNLLSITVEELKTILLSHETIAFDETYHGDFVVLTFKNLLVNNPLSSLGLKINAKSEIIEVSQYFITTSHEALDNIEKKYVQRFGKTSMKDKNSSIWDMVGIRLFLERNSNGMSRLVSTLK